MGVSYLSQKWEGRVSDQQSALLRAFVGALLLTFFVGGFI